MVELTLIIGVSSLLPLNESAFFLLFIYFFSKPMLRFGTDLVLSL